MSQNKLLKTAKDRLKDIYYSDFHHDDSLHVSMEKGEVPFVILTIDSENHPDSILITYAADFMNVQIASDLIIKLHRLSELLITECFYINNEGIMLFGEEAEFFAMEETLENNELMKLEPVNSTKH